jgi:MarR family transcriptional regulator, 2-MHQ and catechol-resistance regulon repressor
MTTIYEAPSVRTRVAAVGGPGEDLSRAGAELSDALSELVRVIQFRDRDRACCYDLSVSQCYALKGVVDAGGLTVNELAGLLYLDKSTASRIANGLVDKGLLTRVRGASDGRVVQLVPSSSGLVVHERIEADLANEYAELLSDFGPDVRQGVSELVGRLSRSFASRVDTSGGSCCVVK